MEYATLEEAAQAAGAHFGIQDQYISYIMAVVNDMTRKMVSEAYNQLGNKMYEHRNQEAAELHRLRVLLNKKVSSVTYTDDMDDLRSRCKDLEDENEKLKAELVALKADGDVLNQNHGTLVNAIKQLQAQVNSLASHPTCTHPHGTPVHAPTSAKIHFLA